MKSVYEWKTKVRLQSGQMLKGSTRLDTTGDGDAGEIRRSRGLETREMQYNPMLEMESDGMVPSLGLMAGSTWMSDPKRLTFVLSRYKFVSKILHGYRNVLEVGSADGFASRIVASEVGNLVCTDFDPVFVSRGQERLDRGANVSFELLDLTRERSRRTFDAAFALDVLEHVNQADEDTFLTNLVTSLTAEGVLLVGMPSLESQKYASEASRLGHVNCKTGEELRNFMSRYFRHVFMFSMNDEVLHTGFFPMSHYLLALGVCPR